VADPQYVVRHMTRTGVAFGFLFGLVVPVALGVAMVTLTQPNGWWFWGFVLLVFVVGVTCGELVPKVGQLSESQAWGEVRLRLDEEGVYFGDEEKFISWSRVVAARLIEERGESQDSEQPPPTWFNLLVEVSECDEFGRDRWGYSGVSQAAVQNVLYRYAPGKVQIQRLSTGFW
jgi:hypothetical protein